METKEIISKGVSFISLSESLDFTSAAGNLQFQILSAFANYEREIIRERTMEGLNRAKTEGKKLGRPKGSKDKKSHARSGYILREAKKRKDVDESKGVFASVESYIDNPPPNK